MSKRERVYFRVGRGCLIPADSYAASILRARGYAMNDLLAAELVKPRNPKPKGYVAPEAEDADY